MALDPAYLDYPRRARGMDHDLYALLQPVRAAAGYLGRRQDGRGADRGQPRMVSDRAGGQAVPRARAHADRLSRLSPLYLARIWHAGRLLPAARRLRQGRCARLGRDQRRDCGALPVGDPRHRRRRSRDRRAFDRHERHDRNRARRGRRARADRGIARHARARRGRPPDRLGVDRALAELEHAAAARRGRGPHDARLGQ